MENFNYLSEQERVAMLNGGFAFRFWNRGVSPLYRGQDAIDFVEEHFSPSFDTVASICFGNNPLISDAYNRVLDEEVYISCEGTGSDDTISVVGVEGIVSFPAFV